MVMTYVLCVWTIVAIAVAVGLAIRGEEVFDAIGFLGLIWIVLVVTVIICGVAEQQYHRYYSYQYLHNLLHPQLYA